MASVIIRGKSERGHDDVLIDALSRALGVIDPGHHHTHEGEHYFFTRAVIKADAETEEIRISIPNTPTLPHLTVFVSASGEADVQVFEGTLRDHVPNNALIPRNRNRNYPDSSMLTVCHTPAPGLNGEELAKIFLGANVGSTKVGGEARGENEIVYKAGLNYLFKVLSGAAGNRITMIFDWYEEEDITIVTSTTTSTSSTTTT